MISVVWSTAALDIQNGRRHGTNATLLPIKSSCRAHKWQIDSVTAAALSACTISSRSSILRISFRNARSHDPSPETHHSCALVLLGLGQAFDRQPPTVPAAFNDNYDTSLYSIRNRFWYVAMSKKF
jgi:hypothetical protein